MTYSFKNKLEYSLGEREIFDIELLKKIIPKAEKNIYFVPNKNPLQVKDAVSVVIDGVKIFIPLDELVDFAKEIERLSKEKAKLESEIKRVNGKLSNEGFVAKAPEALINAEKAKKEKFEEMMKSVVERLENLEAKMK